MLCTARAESNVMLGPKPGKVRAVHREVANKFGEQAVVGVLCGDVAQRGDSPCCFIGPVAVQFAGVGVEK